ncbi:hypothetical protein SLEP1_g59704 [Rubroshorea leprosula]|uniref:Uncharacterized protein n=1 Tax=Rubroshorea leprosula TaxID=152421 RepID=A0AAV5MT52_9ROSI|nr:hypothetical protein SLEP1_g59704 [Rubroshorea leprosula]
MNHKEVFAHQIESARESTLDLDELVLAMRWISTESENFLDATGLDSPKRVVDLHFLIITNFFRSLIYVIKPRSGFEENPDLGLREEEEKEKREKK